MISAGTSSILPPAVDVTSDRSGARRAFGGRGVPSGGVARARDGGVPHTGQVTIAQPMLPLWDEAPRSHRERIVADSTNRVAWLKARSRGVTATDVARLTSERAVK